MAILSREDTRADGLILAGRAQGPGDRRIMGSLRKAARVTHTPARGQATRFRRGEARFQAETRHRRKHSSSSERGTV